MNAPASPAPAFRARNLLGVLAFLMRYRGSVALAIVLLLVNIGLEMTLPQVSGAAINNLQKALTHQAAFTPWQFAEVFIALAVARAAVGLVLGRVRNRLVQATLKDIRAAYFDAVQRLSFAYHDKTNTGELISRGTADISRLQEFLFACLFLGIDITFAVVITMVMITITNWKVGVAAMLTLAPTMGLIAFFARQLYPRWRKVHDLHGEMTTVIQENIAGVRVVKAFAREGDEIAKFRRHRDVFVRTTLATVSSWANRVPFTQFIFNLSTPLTLWIGGRAVIAGAMPVGSLAKIVFYLLGLGNRMGAIGQFVNVLQNASASSERVMEVLEDPLKIPSGSRRLSTVGGAVVVFDKVSFAYPGGGREVLHEVSLEAKAGQTIAVVGATGAGKSTLVHLIPRFYDPTAGAIRIDGFDARELDLVELRRSVGMIFQETVLFSASVTENIAYGRPDATPAQVIAAARAAHAHEFITEMERGYDTVVGERGVSLSGGQKQRLAIARAFLLDPRILILDDATSSLDAKTERLIQEDMRRVCLGRTAFVIAHRLTTVQHAEQVIVLKEGRIVEQGTFAELARGGGLFCELFREQLADREGGRA